jgi:tRNA 2-thiouridine synthesizing protein E
MTNSDAPPVDPEGYLVNPEDWNESVAIELAREEGINLAPDHWLIIEFMQDYWQTHRIAPDVRHVVDFLVENSAYDKKSAKAKLFSLFPYGYVKQACRIAGMQRPRAWSTG